MKAILTSIFTLRKKLVITLFASLLFLTHKAPAQLINFSAAVDSGCAPLNVQFTTNLPVPAYLWDFGDGATSLLQNPSHVYINPGSYTVKLLTTGLTGLTDSLVRSNYITVLNNPVADFQVNNATVCQNSSLISFTNTSQNTSTYIWDFGDGTSSTQTNPTHLYSNTGNYTVQLIAKNNLGCQDIKVMTNVIHVMPQPVVDFSATNTTLCLPQNQTSFTNLSPNCNYQQWSFGDGSSSNAGNPTHIYTQPGLFNVTLIAGNTNGCIDTLTKTAYISVVPQTSPVIITDTTTGCLPLTVHFASAPATSYLWNFGNGITSASATPSFTYTSSGHYNVSVTLTQANGCVQSAQVNGLIDIPEPAIALFSADSITGCAPLVTHFTNLSVNAVSYSWSFGDGHYSTAENPTNVYTNNASHQAILKAFNSAGCMSSYTYTVPIVSSKPHSDFMVPNQVNCSPFSVAFTNLSSMGANSFIWDFGDGSTSSQLNPVHIYTTPGNYAVRLISFNAGGCSDTLVRTNYITVLNPTINFSVPDTLSGCAPFTIAFNDSTFGANSWQWDFGDGTQSTLQHPAHTYTQGGDYTVTLNMGLSNGCTQVYPVFKYIHIDAVHAGFTYTYNCLTHTVGFIDTTANATSNVWSFYDGTTSESFNPTHTYPSTGIYNVGLSVTTAQGCTETISFVNLLHINPCAASGNGQSGLIPPASGQQSQGGSTSGTTTASNQIHGCAPLSVHFSYPFISGTPLTWIFGDNSTSQDHNPTHIYTSAGVYTIMLIYQNMLGLVDTISYNNLISITKPQAAFTTAMQSNCIQYTLTTNNYSTNATNYLWNFGDGNTSQAHDTSHVYTGNDLNYTISLLATDTASGCSSSQTTSLFVSNNNMIWADKYETCIQTAIPFHFSSSSYTNYTWNFGDGTFSSQQNPTHAYATTGSFLVKLTVTDQFGCPHTFPLPQNINIYDPHADFSYTRSGNCSAYEIDFTNLSVPDTLGSNGTCSWNFGDGATSSLHTLHVQHTYTLPGSYQVTLRITTNGGCVSIITKTVQVNTLQAAFHMQQDRKCFPMTVTFTSEATNASSWAWNFGNGMVSSQENPVAQFNQLPPDSIQLIVSDYRGCKDTVRMKDFQLFHNSIALTSDSACVRSDISFSSAQDSVSASWNFGDGSSSASVHPVHAYLSSGQFNIQLISTDLHGCKDTSYSIITTSETTAAFHALDTAGCAPLFVSFTNSSVNAGSFQWNFGDGSGSSNNVPSHIYNIPGMYSVQLIASNNLGCRDTLLLTDYIHIRGPIVSFTLAKDTLCSADSVVFQIQSSNIDNWQWNFGDGASSTDTFPSHVYTHPGNYTVSVIAYDANGCNTFAVDSSLFVSGNPHADYTIDTLSGCAPAALHFNNYSTGATHYAWNFGNGTNASSAQPPIPVYTSPGVYATSLIAYNAAGCSDTMNFNVQIHQKPLASFSASQTSLCPGSLFSLINTSTDTLGATSHWTIDPTTVSGIYNPTLSLLAGGLHTVSLIVTNNNGCSDTLIKENYLNIADSIAPSVNPIRVVSVNSDTTVFIRWEQANCSDFYAYVLYRKNNGTGMYSALDTITDISAITYTDRGLNTLHHSYIYKLQTIDICGNTTPLDQLTANRTIEVSAHLLTNNTIQLNWNAYEGCTLSGYRIERAENNTLFSPIATVDATQTTFIDSTAYCPQKFIYRISALNVCDTATSFSDTTAAKPRNLFKEQKVDITRSTVVNNASILTEWTAPTVMPGAVASYQLLRRENNGSFQHVATLPAIQTSYIDNSVDVNASHYEYKVLVINYCNLSSGTGQNGVSILLEVQQGNQETSLKWTPYSAWETGVEKYIIERTNENGEWETIKAVDGTTTTVTFDEE